jgi:hypothetical protein
VIRLVLNLPLLQTEGDAHDSNAALNLIDEIDDIVLRNRRLSQIPRNRESGDTSPIRAPTPRIVAAETRLG